ncbi:uncharacterized protein EV422DRAFT_513744 [Fimicolochytrium jonesii]|uniref:uncharacterized protein n=1 Tax=Fimicolochytrium jonesii TaxID=1396493 RepID=UPI0022FDEA97|nr:uncharacterized protein EV422DRAFT_513744 [Fimicolochytrium jonesii]KAI8825663.1 hypothetical protein EV422DRAFT_513744 [Fimicolochytrium jonesii]
MSANMEEGNMRRKSLDEAAKHVVRSIRIPLAVALLAFTIVVAGAISIPLGVLSFKGADQSIDDVTHVLRTRLVGEFESSVRNLLSKCLSAADDTRSSFVVNKYMRGYLTNNNLPLDTYEQEFLTSFIQRAERYQSTMGIAVAMGNPGNLPEQYFVSSAGGFGKRCHWTGNATGFECLTGLWLVNNSMPYDPKINMMAFGPPGAPPVWELQAAEKPKVVPVNGVWAPGMFITLGGKLLGGKQCAHYTWARNPPPASGFGSDWDIEYSSVYSIDVISEYLAGMIATPNTRMALIESNGDIMATNKAGAQYNEKKDGSAKLDTCTDPVLKAAGKEILSRYKTYTDTPATLSEVFKSEQNGNVFLDFVRLQDETKLDMIAVLAVPEDDLLAVMKKSRKTAAITVSVIASLMILLAGVASYLFTLPLKRLTNVMVAVGSRRSCSSVRNAAISSSLYSIFFCLLK